jgi:endonuclease/exonuclease/phosphatase family metal-dependent hydrolase
MDVFPAVARRPRVPIRLGVFLTRLNHGFFRSAFVGQANAILVAPGLEAEDLGWTRISDPGREPRVAHAVRISERFVVANFHASTDGRAARAEVDRAREFAERHTLADDVVILAGDFNLREVRLDGYSDPVAGIDHVLVRGAPVSEALVWPETRREHSGVVLSDHAPVELTIE